MNRKQHGFGLLEIMLSLVIVALLLIMATKYYESTVADTRMNQLMQTIENIAGAAQSATLSNSSTSGVDLAAYLPQTDLVGSTTVNNPFGSAFSITETSSGVFTFTVTGPSVAICTQLVNYYNDQNGFTATNSCNNTKSTSANTVSFTYNTKGNSASASASATSPK